MDAPEQPPSLLTAPSSRPKRGLDKWQHAGSLVQTPPPSPGPPGTLRPVLRVRGRRRPAQVQVLLQHLLPELRHLRLAVLLLLPQPPLPRQPLLLLVGALEEQGRGRTAARQREEAVGGEEAGHGVVRGGRRVQGVLHGLGRLQARVLQLLCGGERLSRRDLSARLSPSPLPVLPEETCTTLQGPPRGWAKTARGMDAPGHSPHLGDTLGVGVWGRLTPTRQSRLELWESPEPVATS